MKDEDCVLSEAEIVSALDREDGLGRLVSLAFSFEIPSCPPIPAFAEFQEG